MPGKNMAGGCACCACVTDATQICVCSCPTAYLKTASIGDDHGTHTMTYGGFPVGTIVGIGWFTPLITHGTFMTHSQNGITSLCEVSALRVVQYRYFLQFNCASLKWTLTMLFPNTVCRDTLAGPIYSHYSFPGSSGPGSIPSVTANVDCDTSMIAFSFPTTVGSVSPLLDVPGGGGSLTVVF